MPIIVDSTVDCLFTFMQSYLVILEQEWSGSEDVWLVICRAGYHMLAAFFAYVAGEQIINVEQILHFFVSPGHCVIIILFQQAKSYADIWFRDDLSGGRSKALLFPVLFIILRLLSFPLWSGLKTIMSSVLKQAQPIKLMTFAYHLFLTTVRFFK